MKLSTSVNLCEAHYFTGNEFIIAESIEDICHEFIAAKIITVMYNVQEIIENFNEHSCNTLFSGVDFLHLNKLYDKHSHYRREQ